MRDEQGDLTRDDLEAASRTDDQPAVARRTVEQKSSREPARGPAAKPARDSLPESAAADESQRREGEIPEDEIRERAYELYRTRGGADGFDQADWFAAEQEMRLRSWREPPGGGRDPDR